MGQGSGVLGAGAAPTLRCFLRHMRRQHARRLEVAARGVAAAWLGPDAPSSLPCVGCREPAHLAVVMARADRACYCLRCAMARPELSADAAVLLLRRTLLGLEERARWAAACSTACRGCCC
jgi:hypothetical protein